MSTYQALLRSHQTLLGTAVVSQVSTMIGWALGVPFFPQHLCFSVCTALSIHLGNDILECLIKKCAYLGNSSAIFHARHDYVIDNILPSCCG